MTDSVPVTLLFADGVSHRLAVPRGGKLIEASTGAGLNLLTDCSNGQCGTCTAQLVSGTVSSSTTIHGRCCPTTTAREAPCCRASAVSSRPARWSCLTTPVKP